MIDTSKYKYDFQKLFDVLGKFYPNTPATEENNHKDHKGLKELSKLIVDNIHDETRYKVWEDFDAEISRETGFGVTGTTYGRKPSLSSYIEFERVKYGELSRVKQLHYFVSLTDPFYTVIGTDNNELEKYAHIYHSTNLLIASPIEEYTRHFNYLCTKIENKFPGCKFVPYNYTVTNIEYFNCWNADKKMILLFEAIFHEGNYLDFRKQYLGDVYYKAEDWIIGDAEPNAGWASYPPKK